MAVLGSEPGHVLGLAYRIKNTRLLRPLYVYNDIKWWLAGTLNGSFAQHGEDNFILDYFGGRPGRYIDVGANHPFILSNTYKLYKRGWQGVNVEPIPALCERIRNSRRRDITLNAGVGRTAGAVDFFELRPNVLSTFNHDAMETLVRTGQAILRNTYRVPLVTLADICREYFPEGDPDLLLIDTEGLEMEVLAGADWKRVRPQLVIIETTTVSGAGNVADITDFLRAQRYTPIKKLGCNQVFERNTS